MPNIRHLFWWFSLVGVVALGTHIPIKANELRPTPNCTVVINEFMSAKQRIIADQDGDYSDWIELFNCTDLEIDLTDWYLSDRYDYPTQWQFPETQLPARGYLTLWASGKGHTGQTTNGELHTNFSIDAQGEPLFLSNPKGELIDELPPVAVNAHEAVGRAPDGNTELAILKEPSPSAPNNQAVAPAFIEPPQFSHTSGFYPEEFELMLSHPDPEVSIYYTLDGSEPDPENLNGSTYRYKNNYQQPPKEKGETIEINQDFLYNEYITHRYEHPITITDRTFEPDRISQISTTFDEQPDYFPTPQEEDHWLNNTIHQVNKIIQELNRFGRAINRLSNRGIRKLQMLTSGQVKRVGNKQFVITFPEIEHRVWKKPYRYTYKGTPLRAIAVKKTNHRTTKSPIVTNTFLLGIKKNLASLSLLSPSLRKSYLIMMRECSLRVGIMIPG